MTHKEQLDSFIVTHLEVLCDEYIHWSNTGVLDEYAVMRVLTDKIKESYIWMDTSMALLYAKAQLGDVLIRQKHAESIFNTRCNNG